MFLIDCPHCSRRSLGSWSSLVLLHNDATGIRLVLRCPSCTQTHVAAADGRHREGAPAG